MARSTRRVCRDCGFYLPLAGSLGSMFGVCANELSADGQVVDSEYGCGAHSDTSRRRNRSPLYDPYDDGVLDLTEPADQLSAAALMRASDAFMPSTSSRSGSAPRPTTRSR